MRLLLIRHGQTTSNVNGMLDTVVPGPGLTELGRAQAAAVPDALESEDIQAVYASTAFRTQETATPLAERRRLSLLVRDGLKEIQAGDLEGASGMSEITRYLSVIKQWMTGNVTAGMPNAETGTQALGRFDAAVQEALDAGYGTVAMVSHGAMIRTWSAMRADNVDPAHPEAYELSNTGIVILENNGSTEPRKWRVASWHAAPAGGTAVADPGHSGPEPVSQQN